MDRDAHVRAARRGEVSDALAFEQDREAMLVGQLEAVLAEVEGPRLDADLFALMSPEDATLVRTALGQDLGGETGDEADPNDDDFEFSVDFDEEEVETGEIEEDDLEEEVARLQSEIESSRRMQAALGQYLELLSAPPAG